MLKSMTFGTIPEDLDIDGPFPMGLSDSDLLVVARIVNQGIDSHLEAVRTTQDGRKITILDSESMKCFLRRCVEDGSDEAHSLASDIMQVLRYEWI